MFAKRLQIQERLTREIAEAVMDTVGAAGVAVVVEATCVSGRGERGERALAAPCR